jgi:hypothetical protein
MARPGVRHGCLPSLAFSVLVAFAPPNGAQEMRVPEVRAHFNDAVHDLARRNRLDLATEHRLRDALEPGLLVSKGSLLDRQKTEKSVAHYLREGRFGLEPHGRRLEILSRPREEYGSATRELLSRELVRSFSSVIRRLSIVAELGDGSSQELDHAALGRYLKDNLRVDDYAQVQGSFDTTQAVQIVKLRSTTELLRIFGGDSKPIGRYFFCCLWGANDQIPPNRWSAFTQILGSRWSDASNLATPPGNLRERLALVTIPAGTRVIVGTVADNFVNDAGIPRPGGNTQIFIPELKTFAFQEYRIEDSLRIEGSLSKDTTVPPSEILVLWDDGVLRFRPKAHL